MKLCSGLSHSILIESVGSYPMHNHISSIFVSLQNQRTYFQIAYLLLLHVGFSDFHSSFYQTTTAEEQSQKESKHVIEFQKETNSPNATHYYLARHFQHFALHLINNLERNGTQSVRFSDSQVYNFQFILKNQNSLLFNT